MYRDISKTECPTADHVDVWLAEETGGQVVRAGEPQDMGDYFRVPVFSSDGRCAWGGDCAAGRQMFSVIAPGVASDGTNFQDELIRFRCPESIVVGSTFSAKIPAGDFIDSESIFVESGPQATGERQEFESADGARPGGKGRTPVIGSSKYNASGAQAHDGRFSHPKAGAS